MHMISPGATTKTNKQKKSGKNAQNYLMKPH